MCSVVEFGRAGSTRVEAETEREIGGGELAERGRSREPGERRPVADVDARCTDTEVVGEAPQRRGGAPSRHLAVNAVLALTWVALTSWR